MRLTWSTLLLVAAGAWLVLERGRAHEVAALPGPCAALTQRLCAQLDGAACALARQQLQAASDARCLDLQPRFARVASGLRALAAARAELRAPEQRTARLTAPQLGPDEAELTFVLFCDFEADDCGRAAPLARTATQRYPGRVRFVFRHAPVSRAAARLTAQASLAAHAQGKFWAYHDVLYANPHERDRAALVRYASAAGLEPGAFQRALDLQPYAAELDYDAQLAQRLQVVRSPALFLNGEPVRMPYGITELTALVETATESR